MTHNQLLKEMCYGKKHLFIQAAAGYGKSYLIKQMQKIVNCGVIYGAPTGQAALNINGYTIHSLFILAIGIQNPKNPSSNLNIEKIKMIKGTHTFLIDEISMVRCDIIDTINTMFKTIKRCNEPFGGIRMILVGDIFQLPPVITRYDSQCLSLLYPNNDCGYYFFTSEVFRDFCFLSNLKFYILTYNFRQKNDIIFKDILDRSRMGDNSQNDLLCLNSRAIKKAPKNALIIQTLNNDVIKTNYYFIKLLKDTPSISYPKIEIFEKNYFDRNELRVNLEPLHIKKGMKIMFTMNDNPDYRFVNGSVGFIKDKILSNNNNVEYVIVDIDGKEYEIKRRIKIISRSVWNDTENQVIQNEVARIFQFPFIPAYSITVHKSQGLTLSKTLIDLSKGTFAPGHAYVALSRVRSLNDLFLASPINKIDFKVSESIKDYYYKICENATFVDSGSIYKGNNLEKNYLDFNGLSIIEYGPN